MHCSRLTGIATAKSAPYKTYTTIALCVRDANSSSILQINNPLVPSVQAFTPGQTVLLISFPCLTGSTSKIGLSARSQLDIDPAIPESEQLRRIVARENCPINEHFHPELFDVQTFEDSITKLRFTFSTLEDFIKSKPNDTYMGYLSVILTSLNIIGLVSSRRLFSMSCCNMPLYSNEMSARCEQCGNKISLRLNPDITAGIADATGGIGIDGTSDTTRLGATSSHTPSPPLSQIHRPTERKKRHSRLLWSDEAWTELLGRNPAEMSRLAIAALDEDEHHPLHQHQSLTLLRYLEHRLIWMRAILLIGWTGAVGGGRLAVIKVVQ